MRRATPLCPTHLDNAPQARRVGFARDDEQRIATRQEDRETSQRRLDVVLVYAVLVDPQLRLPPMGLFELLAELLERRPFELGWIVPAVAHEEVDVPHLRRLGVHAQRRIGSVPRHRILRCAVESHVPEQSARLFLDASGRRPRAEQRRDARRDRRLLTDREESRMDARAQVLGEEHPARARERDGDEDVDCNVRERHVLADARGDEGDVRHDEARDRDVPAHHARRVKEVVEQLRREVAVEVQPREVTPHRPREEENDEVDPHAERDVRPAREPEVVVLQEERCGAPAVRREVPKEADGNPDELARDVDGARGEEDGNCLDRAAVRRQQREKHERCAHWY